MFKVRQAAFALLPAALVMAAPQPDMAEVKGRLPNGKTAAVRLQFKKGVTIASKDLPKSFLPDGFEPPPWIPFESLSPQGKQWALKALFPSDAWTKTEVRHKVRWPKLESVWLISALFTGYGQHYDKLMEANPKNPEQLREGDDWRVPQAILSPDFGGAGKRPERGQPEDELSDEARTASFRSLLSYGKDAKGGYAAYKMRKGETLYSSVVMRYTDLVDVKEVNQLAERVAQRSNIDINKVKSIQPGQTILIPLDCLADPFLPEGSKGLSEERQLREEVRRVAKIEAGPRLSGVRIVLDPGHGGIDSGARANGVWESDHVYDIAMRVRRLLENNTDAQISATLRYDGIGYGIRDSIPAMTKDAKIMTTPPIINDAESPRSARLNLRWVLANHIFLTPKPKDPRKTLFVSFHADSLHPDRRGTMVYIPASNLAPSIHSWAGDGIKVAELKQGGSVKFTERQKRESEAQSLIFAEELLRALRRADIPVNPNRPIRNVVKRGGQPYLPAVIRTSNATTKVMIEMVNLQNEEDAALIKNADFREQYAEAVFRAIRAHFKK
jgi:N-acetylmuramoyl-L-alanine amidase